MKGVFPKMNRTTKIMLGVGAGLAVLYLIGKNAQASAAPAMTPALPYGKGGIDHPTYAGMDTGDGYNEGVSYDNTSGEYVNPFDDGALSYGGGGSAPAIYSYTPPSIADVIAPQQVTDTTQTRNAQQIPSSLPIVLPSQQTTVADLTSPGSNVDPSLNMGLNTPTTTQAPYVTQTPVPISTPSLVTYTPPAPAPMQAPVTPVIQYQPTGIVYPQSGSPVSARMQTQ